MRVPVGLKIFTMCCIHVAGANSRYISWVKYYGACSMGQGALIPLDPM